MSDHRAAAPDTSPRAHRAVVLVTRAAALVLFAFSTLPIATWIAGGREVARYGSTVRSWILASIATAIIYAALLLFRGVEPRLSAGIRRWVSAWSDSPRATAIVLALIATSLSLMVAQLVLDGRPLLIDEIVQRWQAQLYARGQLSVAAPLHPELFQAMHVAEHGGRWFSQFPPGWPALLAIGVLARLPSLIDPICLGVATWAWTWCAWRSRRDGTGLFAAVLFAATPFLILMGGTEMNHVPTIAAILVGLLGTIELTGDLPRTRSALLAGSGFGIAATIRPMDALCFAVPAGWLLLGSLRRDRGRLQVIAVAGVALLVPVVAMLAINATTTGRPLLFGYDLLWGPSHTIGFHRTPWDDVHTPGRGVELVNLYLFRLQRSLFATTLPGLLPATIALYLTKRLNLLERYLLASGGLLLAGYFAYWHEGQYFFAPRFVLPLAPAFIWWTARLPELVASSGGVEWRVRAHRIFVAAALVSLMSAGIATIRQWSGSFPTQRLDLAGVLAESHASGVVLVRENWNSQLVARLWGVGVSHADAERITRRVDACRVDSALEVAERRRDSGDGAAAMREVLALLQKPNVGSGVAASVGDSTTTSAAVRARCAVRAAEDRGGTAAFAPTILYRAPNVVIVRDLHGRDTLVAPMDQPRWLLRAESGDPGARVRLYRVDRDSMVRDWVLGSGYRPR